VKPLSKRELSVIQGMVDGETQKEIANRLKVSRWTVSEYLLRAKEKYNAKSFYSLVALVVSDNLVSVDKSTNTP